jgi:hypothetical protein
VRLILNGWLISPGPLHSVSLSGGYEKQAKPFFFLLARPYFHDLDKPGNNEATIFFDGIAEHSNDCCRTAKNLL